MRCLLLLLIGLPLLISAAPTRRFLFLAAANDGGPGRLPLRYALSDAQDFSKVLETFGGVESADAVFLSQPDSASLLAGLHAFGAQISAARKQGTRTELLFYYSGHADEDGLLLGTQRLGYRNLRRTVDSLPADVRLAVLDACASGGALRAKGGVRRPAFLVDESHDLRGGAVLTSSAANEASHESDSLGGSFFTQALLTGLRGAADADHDGRVTLNEAYRYAYQETLRRTEEAKAGSQHPSVDMDLSGSGDVVLTDLHQASAHILLDTMLSGQLSLRDSLGHLVAELRKLPGAPLDLGLESGRYRILFEGRDGRHHADTLLATGQALHVNSALVERWELEPQLLTTASMPAAKDSLPFQDSLPKAPFVNIGLLPPLDMLGQDGPRMAQRSAAELAMAEAGSIRGIQYGSGAAISHGDVRGAQWSIGVALQNGKEMSGVQQAAVSVARGKVRGAQFSSVASIARDGSIKGAQISSAFNMADTGIGAQLAFVNKATAWRGVQAGFVNLGAIHGAQAGFVNVGPFHGAQAGFVNVGKGGRGAQAGFVNVAKDAKASQYGFVNMTDTVAGLQAGFVNVAGRGNGTQMGFVNAAHFLHGAQMGFVNVTDTLRGLQLGFVNVSRVTDGLPIGLISWSSSLPLRVDAWMDENALPTLSLVWEWKWLHSQTDISCDAGLREHPVIGYGSSVGVQLPSQRWILSADIGSKTLTRGEYHQVEPSNAPKEWRLYTNQLLRARMMAGAWVLPHLGLFVGTGWTLLETGEAENNQALTSPMHGIPDRTWTDGLRAWPSLFAGVRLSLRN